MIGIPDINISELTQSEKPAPNIDNDKEFDPDDRIEISESDEKTKDETHSEYDPDSRIAPQDTHRDSPLNDSSEETKEETIEQGTIDDSSDINRIGKVDPMTANQTDDSKGNEKNLDAAEKNEDLDGESESEKHRTPENNGHWDGERGDSKWIPDGDYAPKEKGADKPYSNPENQTWDKLLEKYGIDGITFHDGFPDFSEISRGTVEIDDFQTGKTEAKIKNFNQADRALAEQRGCTPGEVKQWRQDNNYTWHECEDKKTMQKVPNEIHANIPHDGGRSQQ